MRIIDHLIDAPLYMAVVKSIVTGDWMRILLPFLLSAIAGGVVAIIVSQERVSSLRDDVAGIKQRVDTNTEIILRNDERTSRIQVDITNVLQMHQAIASRLDDIDQSGATRCLQCHMKQWQGVARREHPSQKLPLP